MIELVMGMYLIWWVFPIAILISSTVTMLAMEGPVLFAPAFLFLFPVISTAFPNMTPNEAIGVALAIGVFGFGSACIGYTRQRVVDMALALRLVAISVPFAIAARIASFSVPSWIIFILFGLILWLLAFFVARSYIARRAVSVPDITHAAVSGESVVIKRKKIARDGNSYGYSYLIGSLDRLYIGAGGALVGLIGVGAGGVINTVLIVRHELPVRIATGTASIAILATIFTSALTHIGYSTFAAKETIAFEWTVVALAAPAVLIGGQVGPRLAARLPESVTKKALIFMFVLTGAIMFLRGTGAWA